MATQNRRKKKDVQAVTGEQLRRSFVVVQAPQMDANDDTLNMRGNILGDKKRRTDEPTAQVLPAPEPVISVIQEPAQRVIQLALGAQHGLLLTDCGVAYTWGDNRYGQLGRTPMLKEETKPFPVLALCDEEVFQVASGRNHCLALVATGKVWAWGRNRKGQLGCGDARDKTAPTRVCQGPDRHGGTVLGEAQNGEKDAEIKAIAAGKNSSLAAAKNADVWQWGDISRLFDGKDTKYASQVLRQSEYRSELRDTSEYVSIKSTRFVIHDEEAKAALVQIKEFASSINSLREEVGRHKKTVADGLKKEKDNLSKHERLAGDVEKDNDNVQDTIASLERDLMDVERELKILEQNAGVCTEQREHIMEQMQSLVQKNGRLLNAQDEISLRLARLGENGRNTHADRKALEEKSEEIKGFMEANQNSRMTLLDNRSELDKERQHLTHSLKEKKNKKDLLERRIKMFRDLSKPQTHLEAKGIIEKMRALKEEITIPFQSFSLAPNAVESPDGDLFVAAKTMQEEKSEKLSAVLEKVKGIKDQDNVEDAAATQVVTMLTELVGLHRVWMDMQADCWMQADCNLESFFKDCRKPSTWHFSS